MTRPVSAVLAVLAAVLCTIPARAQPSQAALDDLGAALRSERLAPAHAAFADAAEGLSGAVGAYCAGPDAARLEAARAAFLDAADRWMAIQWVGFGPDVFLMRSTRIQFWPDPRNTIGRQLSEALSEEREDLLEPAALADASVALQGLPALERMLFADTRIDDSAYACALARAIAANTADMAGTLARAWQDPAAAQAPTPEGAALIGEVYRGVFEHLTAVVERKLRPVLGETPADARPRLAESWRSERSLSNIARNLDGVAGVVGGPDGPGFAAVLRGPAGAPEVADRLAALLDAARETAGGLSGVPMAAAVAEGPRREDLMVLASTLEDLRRHWEGPVGDALGLRVGFNSMDGD